MVGKTKKKILCMLCSFCLLFLNVFVVSAEDGEEVLARQRKNYTANTPKSVVKELTDAGFVKDEKAGGTTYYRRSVDETGILSLY